LYNKREKEHHRNGEEEEEGMIQCDTSKVLLTTTISFDSDVLFVDNKNNKTKDQNHNTCDDRAFKPICETCLHKIRSLS